MAPRYSIIPGDFAADDRPREIHFRVLNMIGSYTNRAGWCQLKQFTIAERLGLTREAVNRAIKDLVEWGYVAKRAADATGRAIYYRTIMDRAAELPDEADGDEDDDGRVNDGSHVGYNQGSGLQRTCDQPITSGVIAGITPGVIVYDHTERPSLNDQVPPLPPSGGNSAHPGDEQWKVAALAGLRAGGRHPLAVEHLIAPLLASSKRLSLGKGAERNAVLAEIAEAAGGLSIASLKAAAQRIIEQPKKVTPTILRAEVDQARKGGAMFVIRPSMPQWKRWLEHYDETNPQLAKIIRKDGTSWQVPSEWPPARSERGAA